jgi:hypothetical protein
MFMVVESTANITKVESQACITVLKLCDNRHPMTTIANLSMKEGSLFCSYEIHRTGMLQIAFLVSLESSGRGGVHGLGFMAFGLAVEKLSNVG